MEPDRTIVQFGLEGSGHEDAVVGCELGDATHESCCYKVLFADPANDHRTACKTTLDKGFAEIGGYAALEEGVRSQADQDGAGQDCC